VTARRPEALSEARRPAAPDPAHRRAGRARPSPGAEHPRARLAARLAYVAIVLLATLSRLHAEPSLRFAGWRLYRALNPSFHAMDVVDGVRNVVLFAGLGAVWVVTARTLRVWPGRVARDARGRALSVAVEARSSSRPTRVASVLDVLTNGVGAFVGARSSRW
jgi:VanZ family protein